MVDPSLEAKLPEAMNVALVDRIERGALELPVLPEVAAQVVAATSGADCDLRALADLIRRDQTMATHLLRIANSPMYAPRTKIVSLQQALTRLGMRGVREIAILISVKTRAFQVKGHEAEVKLLFQHSLGTALYAQEIARIRRLNVEEAFLSGLLHDVGRPVLIQALVDLYQEFRVKPDKDVITATATEHHTRVGSILVGRWLLPETLSSAIRFHHEPASAGDAEVGAMLTSFADELSHATLGTPPRDPSSLRSHAALAVLNLYPEDVDRLLAQRERIVEMVGSIA